MMTKNEALEKIRKLLETNGGRITKRTRPRSWRPRWRRSTASTSPVWTARRKRGAR